MIDILAALEAAPSAVSGRQCRIGRFIDGIPDDAPGRDALVATLTVTDPLDPHYRPATALLAILARLGEATSEATINKHRAKRCVCNA